MSLESRGSTENGEHSAARHSVSWWIVRVIALVILAIEWFWTVFVWLMLFAHWAVEGNDGDARIGRAFLFVFWFLTQFVLVPLTAGAIAAILTQQSRDRRTYGG